MAVHSDCDGIRRRDFLKAGVLGGAGLTVADYLRLSAEGAVNTEGKAKRAIFVSLAGGPSHMDTFDLKPKAPAEFRGEFNPIKTNVPGIEISEHLPKLAKCMDKYTILRGVSHNVAAHALGTDYLVTGNRPLPALKFPGVGSVMTKERPGDPELPGFVAIPDTPQTPGYLGVRYAPLQTNSTPRAGQPFRIRGVQLGAGLKISDIKRRQGLLNDLDKTFQGFEKHDALLSGLDKFSQQAYGMIISPKARRAFDISKETPAITKLFGTDSFSQSCLLAARLVESGVPFASVRHGGWDTHNNNFGRLKDELLPALDGAISGLLLALEQKGLLESTAVIVTGEFGRTPKITDREGGGRNHWPRAMFVLMAGGGVKPGQVIGASDSQGMGPAASAITPDAVIASYYHMLGIDFTKEYRTTTGRPVMIVRNGKVIDGLLG